MESVAIHIEGVPKLFCLGHEPASSGHGLFMLGEILTVYQNCSFVEDKREVDNDCEVLAEVVRAWQLLPTPPEAFTGMAVDVYGSGRSRTLLIRGYTRDFWERQVIVSRTPQSRGWWQLQENGEYSMVAICRAIVGDTRAFYAARREYINARKSRVDVPPISNHHQEPETRVAPAPVRHLKLKKADPTSVRYAGSQIIREMMKEPHKRELNEHRDGLSEDPRQDAPQPRFYRIKDINLPWSEQNAVPVY
jgi:hypothetical protein